MKYFTAIVFYTFIIFAFIGCDKEESGSKISLNETGTSSDTVSLISEPEEKIISFDSAISGLEIPANILETVTLIEVTFFSFDSVLEKGYLVVNKKVADEVVLIFEEIAAIKFPIEKIKPVSEYDWSDLESMKDNNTSCFNYRNVAGTNSLSRHGLGLAIDINPLLNPYVRGSYVSPPGSKYDPLVPGTIIADSDVVNIFKKYGWQWGGDWNKGYKDYQHFTKYIK
ncbi:MAG: M15 family metallopeptidase [Ignavibacteriaceae bacterium]|nr:M15 family metallopeptidase [Ignavibacteriaceae bacterium]